MKRIVVLVIILTSGLHSLGQLTVDEALVTRHIVILSEGDDYQEIRMSLDSLSQLTGIAIDTLGRGWNSSAESLILSLDDSDDLYAGTFFPRRYSGRALSIEPIEYYLSGSMEGKGPWAIVVDICGPEAAEDYLEELWALVPNITVRIGQVYLGCMH